MRVPTYTQFKDQITTVNRQYNDIDMLREKINSGKKISQSSEDPILAIGIKSAQDYIEKIGSYESVTLSAQNRVSLIETSTKGVLAAVQRASELIHAAQSDTANETDRKNIAKELEGLLNTLVSYSNTRDSSGSYIFAGINSNTEAFIKQGEKYVYNGSLTNSEIQISPETNVIYGESGQSVFGDIKLGNGVFTIQANSANTGTAETSSGSLYDQTNYIEDTYTITFVTNSAGKIAYQIIGADSGQVIPPSPATLPDDAPEYVAGDRIQFNGLQIDIKGSPSVSDEFIIAPSEKQNVLDTMKDLISILKEPIVSDSDKAKYHQKIGQMNSSFSEIANHFTKYISEVGYRASAIDNQIEFNKQSLTTQKVILGKMQDADLYELIPKLTQQMTGMEVTQQCYIKLNDFFSSLLKSGF